MIEEGTLLVDVSGTRVGQVNGLSVLEIGAIPSASPCASPPPPLWARPV